MKKEDIKKVLKFFIFFLIITLPFITITQLIGMEAFLDSFENPDQYICLQDNGEWFGAKTQETKHIIIQRSTHPDFTIEKSDSVVYFESDGEITCSKLQKENSYLHSIKRYKAIDDEGCPQETVYNNQIIGKVIQRVDDNVWNSLSITVWDISIHNLNIRALITE